jgi:hypothetical protein
VHPLLDYRQEQHWDSSDWQYHELCLVDSDSEEEGELPLTTLWQAVAHLLMPDLAAGFQGWSAEDHTGVHLALGAGVPVLTSGSAGSSGGDDVAAWVAESRLRLVTTLDARSVPRTLHQTEVIWANFGGSAHFAAPQLDRGDDIPESSDESDLDEMPDLVPPDLASSDESDLDEMPDLLPPGLRLVPIPRPLARAPEE